MNKTLEMHLKEQRKEIKRSLRAAIYGKLRNDHQDWCAYNDTPENHCTCVFSELLEVVDEI